MPVEQMTQHKAVIVRKKQQAREARPAGWDYNPYRWNCRGPIIVMAVLDVLVAGYLALYQYRVIPTVWEPFFGGGSRTVLNSWLSHVLQVSDAALGALAYTADAVTGLIGGEGRWRTKPWAVIAFAILVGPVGAVSILLVIAQPAVFNAWCTSCIVSAILSIAMIGPAMEEALACLQFLRKIKRDQKANFWNVFWGRAYVGADR